MEATPVAQGPVDCGVRQYRNAKACIAQIKRGEWKPLYNPISKRHLCASRNGLELWVGNGAWFCEINGGYFGLLWRHWVWWAAARKMTRNADRNMRQKNMPVLDA